MGNFITPGEAWGVYVLGSYAYVADRYRLMIIDISNPSNPSQAGFYDTPKYTLGAYVSGSYAFVADGETRLQIYENLLSGIEEKEDKEINVLTSFILRNSSFIFELPYFQDVSISIYDVARKLVKSKEGSFNKGKNYIRCDNLKSCVYFYKIRYRTKENFH